MNSSVPPPTSSLSNSLGLKVVPFALYRIEGERRCKGPGYLFTNFYDAKDQKNYADVYTHIDPSPVSFSPFVSFFMARVDSVRAEVGIRSIDNPFQIRNLLVREVSKEEVLREANILYDTLPCIIPAETGNLWDPLPQTKEAFQKQGVFRIVSLGDSISNDLLNGLGHLQIEQKCPGLHLEIVHANGPEKEARKYNSPAVLDRLVSSHHPDLLMIGGMSHDPDSVRSIVQKCRKRQPSLEVLYFDASLNGDPHRTKRLNELKLYKHYGKEENFAVIDYSSPFQQTIQKGSQPLAWYQRDHVHANDRGKQLLSRLFAGSFLEGLPS